MQAWVGLVPLPSICACPHGVLVSKYYIRLVQMSLVSHKAQFTPYLTTRWMGLYEPTTNGTGTVADFRGKELKLRPIKYTCVFTHIDCENMRMC